MGNLIRYVPGFFEILELLYKIVVYSLLCMGKQSRISHNK